MKDLSIIFQGNNLRYLTELRGSEFSRFFYNKPAILIYELGRFLSFYSPGLYFSESFLIIFFPFWLIGVIIILSKKDWKILIILLIMGIPVYLMDKRDLVSTLPIGIVYAYITLIGLRIVIKKWRK